MTARLFCKLAILIGVPVINCLCSWSAGSSLAAAPPPVPYHQPAPVRQWNAGRLAGVRWMIKANDYAEFPFGYGRWDWMLCGKSVVYGADQPFTAADDPMYPVSSGPCERGQVPVFTSYWELLRWLARGARKGQTVVFDTETWSWTPAREIANQTHYIQAGCQAARRAGVTIISTPAGKKGTDIEGEWAAAARYCSVAEVQAQGWVNTPAVFDQRVRTFLRIVRSIHHHSPVMVGLGSDTGAGTVKVGLLLRAFRWARARGVSMFWMNACAWWGRPGASGTGDPRVAESFFKALGYRPRGG